LRKILTFSAKLADESVLVIKKQNNTNNNKKQNKKPNQNKQTNKQTKNQQVQ